jgi:hypothetical protein
MRMGNQLIRLSLLSALALGACAETQLTPTGVAAVEGAAIGGVGGAATGALIGEYASSVGAAEGAMIGGAVGIPLGIAAGIIYHDIKLQQQLNAKNVEILYNQEEIAATQLEIETYRRELDDTTNRIAIDDSRAQYLYVGQKLGNPKR